MEDIVVAQVKIGQLGQILEGVIFNFTDLIIVQPFNEIKLLFCDSNEFSKTKYATLILLVRIDLRKHLVEVRLTCCWISPRSVHW